MAEPLRLPHSDPERPLREATAYLHGELSPEETASFEAHLPGCDDCRQSLQVGRLVFPKLYELLAADRRPRTAVDALALLDEAQAKLDSEKRAEAAGARRWAGRRSWAPRALPWLLSSAAAAALVAVIALQGGEGAKGLVEPALLAATSPHRREFAPPQPDMPPPPPIPALAVAARIERPPGWLFWRHPTLTIEASREAEDRYVAIGLIDGRGQGWQAVSGAKPDPSCVKGCGPLRLRVDLKKLPEGAIDVVVEVGPESIDDSNFAEGLASALASPAESQLDERAAGAVRAGP